MKIPEDPSSDGERVNMEMGIEAAEDSLTTVPIGSSAPGFLPKEDAHTIKKRRLLEPVKDNENPTLKQEQSAVMIPQPAPFTILPFDILETILEQTGYIGDLISVSRTCRASRIALKDQSASGLWRKMRNLIGIPDPSDFVEQVEGSNEVFRVERFVGKEAEFASFVFSEGDCEVCGTSRRMFASFTLRLRLCGNANCKEKIKEKLEISGESDNSASWVKVTPTLETNYINEAWGPTRYWPFCPSITRKDWIQDCALDTQEKDIRVARTRVWMKLCVAICKWRDHWLGGVRRVRKRNQTLAKDFAKKEGWEYLEMLTETSYGRFHDMKTKRREEVTEKDLGEMRSRIACELYEFKEKRDRRKMMRLRESNGKDIWKHYQKLMSQPESYPILPPFTLFLKLPSIVLLQSSGLRDAKIDVRTAVRSKGFVKTMIKEEVENWAEKVKRQMLAIVGGSTEWNNMVATRRMPHPVLRLNVRWKCKLCNTVEPKYANDECLDFAGICRHQCKERTKKKRGEEGSAAWNINNFELDEQACSALTSCLKYVPSVAEEPSETRKRLQEKYWRCNSCNPPVLVRAQNIAGHSHRHPAPMQIELIELHAFWPRGPLPNPAGVSQWLKQNSQDARVWVNKANYACQYCKKTEDKPALGKDEEDKVLSSDSAVSKVPDNAPSADVVMKDGRVEGVGGNETKLEEGKKAAPFDTGTRKKVFENKFDFNGLRSHLSSKHKIYQIRDEDFWCHQPIDTFEAQDFVLTAIGWISAGLSPDI